MEKIIKGVKVNLYILDKALLGGIGPDKALLGRIGPLVLGDILDELDTKELKALRNRVNKLIKFKEKVEQNGKAN